MGSFTAAGIQQISPHRTVSIIIPFFNEADNLPVLVDMLDAYITAASHRWSVEFELVFVDDGGTDGGLARLRAHVAATPRNFLVRLLRLSRNFGKDAALTAGLADASADAVVFMDADLQHPPSVIDAFLAGWIAEGYDVVCAYQARGRPEPWLKRRARSLYRELSRSSAPAPAHPDIGDFRLMSRRAYEALRNLGERQRLMRGLYDWVGFRTKAVPYTAPDRLFGASKFSPVKLLALGIEGITASSVAPLRLAVWAGMSLGLLAGIYGLWTAVQAVVGGVAPPGYPTIVCTILLIGAAQLVFLGIIGEYLGKVLAEVKGRPIYVLESDCVLAGADQSSWRTQGEGRVYSLDRQ